MSKLKTYIIVESPGKVNSIQKYLGEDYIVCASNGQIVDLAKGGQYGIGVNPLNNFKTYYKLNPDKAQFLDQIICNIDNIKQIIIATDPDTEGHGIAWHISQYLKHLNKPMLRAEFHEITKEGILNGLKNISELDFNKFKAQETRRILDRIVGFMVSPYLINFYKSNLSAGRVQSVATRMVVEREREIKDFKSQEYWNLGVILLKDTLLLNAKYNGKIKTKEEAEKIKSDLITPLEDNNKFKIFKIVKKNTKDNAPPPLNTSKMQQLMASKFKTDGDRTMQAAQTLYELGLVTYIRTDSLRISETALKNVREWLVKNNYQISEKPNIFKNKDAAQNAHECIRPTNCDTLPEQIQLSEDANNLYKLIWTCFVASQMPPAIYNSLSADLTHLPSNHKFKLSAKILTNPGYLYFIEGKDKDNNKLPEINKDDLLYLKDCDSIKLEQKFTQPPARYNYASLIEELENKGIGRPSTYVQIISKITDRHYVEKKGSTYYGTELGEVITNGLSKYFDFMNYNYTANLEQQMDEIADGKLSSNDTLNKFYNEFLNKLKSAHQDAGGKVCPICSAPMYVKTSKDGKEFLGCALYPFCFSTEKKLKKMCA